MEENYTLISIRNHVDTLVKFCDSKSICKSWTLISVKEVPSLPKNWYCHQHIDERQEFEKNSQINHLTLKQQKSPMNSSKKAIARDKDENYSQKQNGIFNPNLSFLNFDSNNKEIASSILSDFFKDKNVPILERTISDFKASQKYNTVPNQISKHKHINDKLAANTIFLSKVTKKKIRELFKMQSLDIDDPGNIYIYAVEFHSKYGQHFKIGTEMNVGKSNIVEMIACPIIYKLINPQNKDNFLIEQVAKVSTKRVALLKSLIHYELATYMNNLVEDNDDICSGCRGIHIEWFRCGKDALSKQYDYMLLGKDKTYYGLNLIMKLVDKWLDFIHDVENTVSS